MSFSDSSPAILKADAAVAFAGAPQVMDALCKHFAEHAEVTRSENVASLVTPYGSASLRIDGERLAFAVEGPDETSLAFMKLSVAEHLMEFAGEATPALVWSGDGVGSTVPPFFREMRVAASIEVTPRMRRLTLRGTGLARFALNGLHIRLLFPPKDREQPKWPELGPDGRLVMPDGEDALTSRIYTIRRIDVEAGEVDVDMVLHPGENMPGSEFAVNARPGDLVGMSGPGGGGIPDASRLLLFGDETALPAIGRILAAIDPQTRGGAFIEVHDENERQDLVKPDGVEVTWLARRSSGLSEGELLSRAVRENVGPRDNDAFVWVAGEFAVFRAARKYLRGDLGRTRDDHLCVSYWRRGVTGDGKREKK